MVDKAAEFWGRAARGLMKGDYPVHWLESPLVLRHCVNPRISGDPETGWLEWLHQGIISVQAHDGFVLGCGGGALERRAARLGICQNFYCVDVSSQAVEVAAALATREECGNFRHEVRDANSLSLEADSLDLVLSDMALHHVTRLEHLLDQFRRALRPGGWLVLNEFVGPDRFQWSDLQLALATRLIRALPLRLRRNRDLSRWKRYLKPWLWRAKRWSMERVAQVDPSESVRSSEIPRLAAERFDMRQQIGYGGTLLALVLNNIVGNFTDSPGDIRILKDLASEEDRLIRIGVLPSDYVLIAAQRTGSATGIRTLV
jgi:SAM-dependent methyltransferase